MDLYPENFLIGFLIVASLILVLQPVLYLIVDCPKIKNYKKRKRTEKKLIFFSLSYVISIVMFIFLPDVLHSNSNDQHIAEYLKEFSIVLFTITFSSISNLDLSSLPSDDDFEENTEEVNSMEKCIKKYGFTQDGNRVYSGTAELILKKDEEKSNRVVGISPNGESDKLIDLSLCIISFNQWDRLTCRGNKSFLLKVAQKVMPSNVDGFEPDSLNSVTFINSDNLDFSDSGLEGPSPPAPM